jgi:hypothetical protein
MLVAPEIAVLLAPFGNSTDVPLYLLLAAVVASVPVVSLVLSWENGFVPFEAVSTAGFYWW